MISNKKSNKFVLHSYSCDTTNELDSQAYEAGCRGGRPPPRAWKISGQILFSGQALVAQKSWTPKKYLNTVKNSRATLFFRASASCSKILNNKKYIFRTLNSGHPTFFRASVSCSKILNVKSIFNTVKNSRATLFFRTSVSCSKILNVKSIYNTVKNSRATLVSGQARDAQKSWM